MKMDFNAQKSFSSLNNNQIMEMLFQYYLKGKQMKNQLGLDSTITFGIEVEFIEALFDQVREHLEQMKGHSIQPNWEMHLERSVQTWNKELDALSGGEVVSPVLNDTEQAWKEIELVCKMLKERGANTGTTTGAHIHFGAQILGDDTNHLLRFIKLWLAYEDVILMFGYGEQKRARKSMKEYAKPISNELLRVVKHPKEFERIISSLRGTKYHSINFFNIRGGAYDFGNTYEVRSPDGTISPVLWQNYIYFFSKLFLYAKSPDYNDDLINYWIKEFANNKSFFSQRKEPGLEKIIELADIIFDNDQDKLAFIDQTLKCKVHELKGETISRG